MSVVQRVDTINLGPAFSAHIFDSSVAHTLEKLASMKGSQKRKRIACILTMKESEDTVSGST